MGSLKPFPQYEAKSALANTDTDADPYTETNIAVLQNAVYYFLQHVFIIIGDDDYRLVVLHNNRILTDSHYETLRGAKIAFYKRYNRKAWKMGVKANWSHTYNPDRDWLEAKHNILGKPPMQSVH